MLVARVSDLKSKMHAQVKDGCQEEEEILRSQIPDLFNQKKSKCTPMTGVSDFK